MVSASSNSGDGHQRRARNDAGTVAVGRPSSRISVTTEPNECPWATSGRPGVRVREPGQRVGERRTVLDRAEIAAGAGA